MDENMKKWDNGTHEISQIPCGSGQWMNQKMLATKRSWIKENWTWMDENKTSRQSYGKHQTPLWKLPQGSKTPISFH